MRKYLLIFIVLLFAGCNKWLNITPSDTMSEEQTFSSVEGFKNVLNSVYIEMNHENLYGKDLSVGYIEFIASRYYINEENTTARQLYEHKYNNMSVSQATDKIWKKAYNLIANINLLLKYCEKNKSVIEGKNYDFIKGEALALRAFIHFDLFRMFGPIYKSTSPAAIPYNQEFKFTTPQIMTCEVFMNYVMSDLNEAKRLLSQDPIITTPPTFSDNTYDYFRNRTNRMNYYAVTLLKARAALYMEEKETALTCAKEIIAIQKTHYPFSTKAQVENSSDPDRIFSSELIFALEFSKRDEIFDKMFDPEVVSNKTILAPTDRNVKSILFGSSTSLTSTSGNYFGKDLRSISFTTQRTVNSKVYYFPFKYKSIEADSTMLNRLMPIMRVSEAFYIAAECETDDAAAYEYLNQVRRARGIDVDVRDNKDVYILREYITEFFGEGQLFFFYKRKNTEKISNGDAEISLSMTNAYQIPIPSSEHP